MRKQGLKKQYVIGYDDAIGAGISLIPAISKYFTGRKQDKLADQYAKTKRPLYETPTPIKQNLAIAKNLAGSRMTGEGFLRSRLDRTLANATKDATTAGQDSSSILNTIAAASSNQMAGESDLTYKGQQWHDAQTKGLMNQNQVSANYLDKEWDWNKKQPYTDAMAASSALRNSALQNKYGALSDASKALLGLTMKGTGLGNIGGNGKRKVNTDGWTYQDPNSTSDGVDTVPSLPNNTA